MCSRRCSSRVITRATSTVFSDHRRARRWRSINPPKVLSQRARWTSRPWKRSEWRNETLNSDKPPRKIPRRLFLENDYDYEILRSVQYDVLHDVDLGGVIVRAAAVDRPRFIPIVPDGFAPDRSVAWHLDRSRARRNHFHLRCVRRWKDDVALQDRKSTRLNSSH